MSADLTWLLTRNGHSRVVRRPNTGLRPISFEAGNLRNVHAQKDSGYGMERTIDIRAGQNGSIAITKRKTKSEVGQIAKGRSTKTIRARSGKRRVAGLVSAQVSKCRLDLLKPALARANRLASIANKKAEPAQKKPVRGKKVRAARNADAMDVDN